MRKHTTFVSIVSTIIFSTLIFFNSPIHAENKPSIDKNELVAKLLEAKKASGKTYDELAKRLGFVTST